MTLQSVCDAWMDKLTTSISGLTDATQHLYVSGAGALADSTPGRHIAVFPVGDLAAPDPFVAGSPPAKLATITYQVMVWEGAHSEATRVYDDDDANAAWLALYEQVRAKFYELASQGLGEPGPVDYAGGAFDSAADKRVFVVSFTKRTVESFT
jgi:hypothetical protein